MKGANRSSKARFVVLGLVSALGLASCTIIIEPKTMPPPINPPPGGGGPGIFGCFDTGGVPTADIFVDMRIERSTVNLAPTYSAWLETTALALAAAQIMTAHAVLIRADERPVGNPILASWGCNTDDPKKLPPERVIRYFATQTELVPSPIGCATDPLATVGQDLSNIVSAYPPELGGTSGLRIFGAPPSIVLVIHIDERARRTAYSACPSAARLGTRAKVDGKPDRAGWLQYIGDGVPADRVIHWFITTDELVDRDSFVTRCKRYDGFPADVLDIIDPSQEALFGPLQRELDHSAGRAVGIPLCQALSQTEMVKFMKAEIHKIAEIAGTKVDEGTLKQVFNGTPPVQIPPGASQGAPRGG